MRKRVLLISVGMIFVVAGIAAVLGILFLISLANQEPTTKDANYYHDIYKNGGYYARRHANHELAKDPAKGVPILIEVLSREKLDDAERCLWTIGADAVPELLDLEQKTDNIRLRCSLLRVLYSIVLEDKAKDQDRENIIKELAIAFSDKSPEVQKHAGLGLSILRGERSAPVLRKLLSDEALPKETKEAVAEALKVVTRGE
ncbi:MAG: HEAT repeat domain-containing protein [Planctomycetes bacterium]|nr:HEAT repeat domain-containing protein [Planctomycetota bacterium]